MFRVNKDLYLRFYSMMASRHMPLLCCQLIDKSIEFVASVKSHCFGAPKLEISHLLSSYGQASLVHYGSKRHWKIRGEFPINSSAGCPIVRIDCYKHLLLQYLKRKYFQTCLLCYLLSLRSQANGLTEILLWKKYLVSKQTVGQSVMKCLTSLGYHSFLCW